MLRTNRSPSRSAFFMLRLHGTNRANPSSVGQATLSSALPPLGGDANSAVVGGKIPRDWSLDRRDVIEHQSVVSTQRSCKPKSSNSVLHAADALFHRLFGNKIMEARCRHCWNVCRHRKYLQPHCLATSATSAVRYPGMGQHEQMEPATSQTSIQLAIGLSSSAKLKPAWSMCASSQG